MTNKKKPSSPIGIFDSGPGGLAVLREVRRLLPHEEVLYFGDTARQPYGPQPVEDVARYAREISAWLAEKGVKLIIIGCNTASVAAANSAQGAQTLVPELPVLGMVEPAVQTVLQTSVTKRIGVWGTEITVESKAYDRLILAAEPDAQVLGAGCADLLRLAEKGQVQDKPRLRELAERYFRPLADFGIDTLILGCTDLTCVRDVIDEVVGQKIKVVDPAEEVVLEARRILQRNALIHPEQASAPAYRFHISGENLAEFSQFTAEFMQLARVNVSRVAVAQLSGALEALEGKITIAILRRNLA